MWVQTLVSETGIRRSESYFLSLGPLVQRLERHLVTVEVRDSNSLRVASYQELKHMLKTKTKIDYFCSIPDYFWHKLEYRNGDMCVAKCGYVEDEEKSEVTSCVFIGLRCKQCFEEDEFFDMEQCGF